MVLFDETITLLNRQLITPTASTDLPASMTGTTAGDLTPWRIRLEMTNTGETGVDNSGSIKLRIDEKMTFLKVGPLLMEEDAKTKYLIEAKITQTQNGVDKDSKVFRFQIGTPQVHVDQSQGGMMTIQLQEIQRRTQEVLTSRELRFLTPRQTLDARMVDMINFGGATDQGVNMPVKIYEDTSANGGDGSNQLPLGPELEYVPQTPIPIKKAFDTLFENLSEAQATGGVFTDFYYDYDPIPNMSNGVYITADEIGRIDTGCVIDPVSASAIDAEELQDVNTNFFKFRNHIIARGAPASGSLPTEHQEYASHWLHARLRPEWNSGGFILDTNANPIVYGVKGRDGVSYKYLKGQTVKRTFTLPEFTSTDPGKWAKTVKAQNVIRFFIAVDDITGTTAPESDHANWKEDFLVVPEFDRTGHYTAGDVVYFKYSGNTNRFYQAHEDIYDFSINRYREWEGGWNETYPRDDSSSGNKVTNKTTIHLNDSDGFLFAPNQASGGWYGKQSIIPDHTQSSQNYGDSFEEHKNFSPWTADLFDWEKNMAGLKSGSLPYAGTGGYYDQENEEYTVNRYCGMMPDWNIAKDVYEKQDSTDEFENVTMKWVHAISNTPPSRSQLIYHGQRMLIGSSASPTNWGNPTEHNRDAITASSLRGRVAQYVYDPKGHTHKGTGWRVSREPVSGDIINNLDDGRVYQYTGSEWEVSWKQKREVTADMNNTNQISPATPFHIVKDIYKVKGFDGTPNNGVEVRYAWDTDSGNNRSNDASKKRKVGKPTGGAVNPNAEALGCRKNSRGIWLWFWNPFPRLDHQDNGSVNEGDKFGGNGNTSAPKTGFTTFNIYNNNSNRLQSTKGWNNGLKTEDMGKVSGLSFRIKVGIYAQPVDRVNDQYFWELDRRFLVVGEADIPMTFWAIDMFDRIWFKKFTVRKNGNWDAISINFGDMSVKNLHIPRFDELSEFFNRPLSFTNFALPEKEYSGVMFDWRFVRGWGIQADSAYDVMGFYNGGFDHWIDMATQTAEQFKQALYNMVARVNNWWEDVNATAGSALKKMPIAYTMHNQATIALDDLHYDKELIANSDVDPVLNARTTTQFFGNISDYLTLRALARAKRERLSFYPQFWHLRSIGDVRMRVGQSFKVKGDRMPNMVDATDLEGVWSSGTTYSHKQKVSYNGYVYQSLQNGNQSKTPDASSSNIWWTNMNELHCAEVVHVIDHSGYHMEVTGRRKFITSGE